MGQALIELGITGAVKWADGDTVFQDSPGVNWYSESVIRLGADGDFADRRYWSDYIIRYTPPQFQMADTTGGFCKMDWGDLELRLDVFAGSKKSSGNALFADSDTTWLDGSTQWVDEALTSGDANLWPPPREIYLDHRYTETDESGLVLLFSGTGHLQAFDRESVKYDLYPNKDYSDINLLTEITDYNGDTVALPRALGAVVYCVPVRLPDVGIYPTYHKAYISGATPGADYNVYDDGVDINSNVTDNGDGTFSLDASPVGQVSISGTGAVSTLSGLFSYMAGELGLSYTYDSALEDNPSPALSYWADSQQVLVDFVSDVAKYFEHYAYVNYYTLMAGNLSNANNSRTLTEYDFFPVAYEYPVPVAILKSAWQKRTAGEWSDGAGGAAGVYVKSEPQEASAESNYKYGTEQTITAYQYAHSDITTRLESLISAMHKCQVHLSIPISDSLPVPGERIAFTDETSFPENLDVTMYCRNLQYDFENDTVVISGDGDVS